MPASLNTILLLDADADRTARVRQRLEACGVRTIVRAVGDAVSAPNCEAALLVAGPEAPEEHKAWFCTALQALREKQVSCIAWGVAAESGGTGLQTDCLSADTPLDEVVGRLSTMAHYVPLIRQMERELSHLQSLSSRLTRYFSEVDNEMRLAGRLQRDFLPTPLPDMSPLSIHTIYRPASFVSGDTYDVDRIDDRHAGIFLADAMGHGVAAGLITMSLQQALMSKETMADVVRVVRPPEVLTRLHYGLVRQQLPSCQFVTAVYVLADVVTQRLRISRGGHPYPIHISRDGELREVAGEGGLLGLADIEPDFDEVTVQLQAGEKLVLYTDGIEDIVIADAEGAGQEKFVREFRDWAQQDAAALLQSIENHLDRQEGSLNPADDVTVLVLEHVGVPANT